MKKQAQTTAEAIAEAARDIYHETKYCAISPADIEKADAYTSEHMSITTQVMNILGISHASKRVLVCIALAMQDAATEPTPAPYLIYEDDPATDTAENRAAEDAANALISAYADAIGEYPAETDPEFVAAYRVAAEDVAQAAPATDQQRATVADMVEAIVQQAERIAAERIVPEAVEIYGNNYEDAVSHVAYTAYRLMTGERMPDTNEDFERLDRIMGYAAEIVPADPYPYQRHELEAYLGSAIDSYDVDAIEHEATEHDPKTGRAMWTPEAVRDLWSICQRHELKA